MRGTVTAHRHSTRGHPRKDHGQRPPFPERTIGRPVRGVPEVVLVQGMAVADHLLPGLAALGRWTRAHLVELLGFGGSGEPPHERDVPDFGHCITNWLSARRLGPVLLGGRSSGTQVAAHIATEGPDIAGVVLGRPTVDPVTRGWLRLLVRWRLDSRREPDGLCDSHRPGWKRAGPRRHVHTVHVHVQDPLEETVARIDKPLLDMHGDQDVICTSRWARHLADLVPGGRCIEVPGAHTFPWLDPESWSDPIHTLAQHAA